MRFKTLFTLCFLAFCAAFFNVNSADASDGDWQGRYYNNRWFSGNPVMQRDDPEIDFTWGYGSPASSIPTDRFSVRWSKTVQLPANATYLFTAESDDTMQVRVNGRLVISTIAGQFSSAEVELERGRNYIIVEYTENTLWSEAHFDYAPLADESVNATAYEWFTDAVDTDDIATEEAILTPAAIQQFEYGVMIWNKAEDTITVLSDNGWGSRSTRTIVMQDNWDESQPIDVPVIEPSEGLFRPTRGFGKIWRENPEICAALGFATAVERGYMATYQAGDHDGRDLFYITTPDDDQFYRVVAGDRWGSFQGSFSLNSIR